jgi:diguanylate cyclase (GGDEF)-like protein/PAS domain S-box-containing protein
MKNAQLCIKLIEESEAKFLKIAENSLVGMFIYTEYFSYVNDAFVKMTGYSREELLQMHPWKLVETKSQEAFKNNVQRRLRGEMFTYVDNDSSLVKKDGKRVPVKVSTETIRYKDRYAGIGIIIDISDIVRKNKIINVLVQAFSQSDDIIFVTDKEGYIEYANQALLDLYGYEKDEVLGATPKLFYSGKNSKELYATLWSTILRGENYHHLLINKKKNGDFIHVDTKIIPVKIDQEEQISHFVVTARDMTQRVLDEEKFKKLATIDLLTQIPNRYQFHQYFDDFIARVERKGEHFSVLLFDIDHFKQINDNFGHYVGDRILKAFSALVMANIRTEDKFARWGGEEFILLLDNATEHEAMYIANKINKIVARTIFDELYCITVSIGVTEYRKGETKNRCINRADKALYTAKNLGRNCVVFA